jgi:cell division protein FtsB
MMEKVITLLVGLLIALGGWTLTRTFELSTDLVVSQEKVNKLEKQVEKLEDQMDDMMDMDEEIVRQHENLFQQLSSDKKGKYEY